MPRLTTEQARIQGEIRYTLLVFAFIAGKIATQDVPLAHQYGVSEDRASEIIGWALICDMADRAMTYQPPISQQPCDCFICSALPAEPVNSGVRERDYPALSS